MNRKRPFRSEQAFEFKCRFIRAAYRGSHITVTDGTKVTSPWSGTQVSREIRILVKNIEGGSSLWALALNPNQAMTLVLPQWQIDELGINGANDLQRIVSDEESGRVLPRSRVARN